MAKAKEITNSGTAKGKGVAGNAAAEVMERRRLVSLIRGKYAWIPYSSEDFIRDKRKEIDLEDRA